MERKKIFEFFEKYKDYTKDRINTGIEHNKKGYSYLTIKDADGNPINGQIKIRQKSHEFKFGVNLFMLDQLETEEKNKRYEEDVKNLFNMTTLPFYWNDLEPEKGKTRYEKDTVDIYRRPQIDKCIEYCEKNGIEPREHALAYEHFFPDWLKEASVPEIKREYERRCSEISERYADKINTIEVTNELFWDRGITAIYDEPDYVEYMFKTARKYFPANQLVINEWSGVWNEHCRSCDPYYCQIERALLKGAPIDAIGLQYHMFYRLEDEYKNTRKFYNPMWLYKMMDMYSSFDKPLQVTEVTIPCYSNSSEDEELQAEILKLLYSIWFSHENTEQIIYWNLVDGYAAFAPQGDMTAGENYYYGGLIRFDFTKKPAYYALQNLIHKEWHTEEDTEIINGAVSFKGFYGDYDLEITANGKVYNKEISLSKKGGKEFEIIL